MLKMILKLDWVTILAVWLILGIGILMLYSLSLADPDHLGGIFWKQLAFAGIGIFLMFFFALTDYRYFAAYSKWIYFGTILLLTVVLFWSAPTRGTAGWLGFGSFKFQPVEAAKLSLIIFLASFISRRRNELLESSRIIASLVMAFIMIFLVLRQPDLGSAIVLMGIWFGMTLVSGLSRKKIALLFLAGAVLVGMSWFFLADYQKARIQNLFHPENDPRGTGYNVIQSVVAVGSGGLTGKGVGHGTQSQLNFLPEKHTDFIFAVTTEELGILGSFLVLGLYGLILYRLKSIAQYSQDNMGYLMTAGVMIMLSIQIVINVGMNIGLVPVTGITLPLLSYGGSSLVSFLASLGITLNIYQKRDFSSHRSAHSY